MSDLPAPRAAAFTRRSALDLRTAALLALLWGGLALAYEGHRRGVLPAAAASLLGLLSMNLAFTVWHEGIHQTFARSRRWNHALGRLGAIPVFIPYSRLRIHHLLHHRFTNEPEKDPDHWQVRGPFWSLLLRMPAGEREARRLVMGEGPTPAELWADRIQLAASGAVLAGLLWLAPWSALFAIVLPRALLVYVHALYVNYLPHAGLPAGRYASSRILPVPEPVGWLMLHHNYHALHHAHPAIPWHRYERAYAALRGELEARGIGSLRPGELLALLRGSASP